MLPPLTPFERNIIRHFIPIIGTFHIKIHPMESEFPPPSDRAIVYTSTDINTVRMCLPFLLNQLSALNIALIVNPSVSFSVYMNFIFSIRNVHRELRVSSVLTSCVDILQRWFNTDEDFSPTFIERFDNMHIHLFDNNGRNIL